MAIAHHDDGHGKYASTTMLDPTAMLYHVGDILLCSSCSDLLALQGKAIYTNVNLQMRSCVQHAAIWVMDK